MRIKNVSALRHRTAPTQYNMESLLPHKSTTAVVPNWLRWQPKAYDMGDFLRTFQKLNTVYKTSKLMRWVVGWFEFCRYTRHHGRASTCYPELNMEWNCIVFLLNCVMCYRDMTSLNNKLPASTSLY